MGGPRRDKMENKTTVVAYRQGATLAALITMPHAHLTPCIKSLYRLLTPPNPVEPTALPLEW